VSEIVKKSFEIKKDEIKMKNYEENEQSWDNAPFNDVPSKREIKKSSIVYADLMPEEKVRLTSFLESKKVIKWGENLLPNIALSGYINNEPFIVYATPYNENTGFIVLDGHILKFDSENYREDCYSEGVEECFERGDCAGKFNLKRHSKTVNTDGITSTYKVETYNNYADVRTDTYTTDKKITKVIDDLEDRVDFIRYRYEHGLDKDYKSYHLNKSIVILGESGKEQERLSLRTIYPCEMAANFGIFPFFVSVTKNGDERFERNFILEKNGCYIDVEAYIARDKKGFLIKASDLEDFLAKEGLLLEPSYDIMAWLENDNIRKHDFNVILKEYKKSIAGTARILKNN